MKNRKVHFTESQVNEIMRKLNEGNGVEGAIFNGDNFDNMSTQNQIEVCKDVASNNPNMKVSYMGREVNPATNTVDLQNQIRNDASSIVSGGISESKKTYTKKQLKEAKLRYLRENSVSCSKKEFMEKLLGK